MTRDYPGLGVLVMCRFLSRWSRSDRSSHPEGNDAGTFAPTSDQTGVLAGSGLRAPGRTSLRALKRAANPKIAPTQVVFLCYSNSTSIDQRVLGGALEPHSAGSFPCAGACGCSPACRLAVSDPESVRHLGQ